MATEQLKGINFTRTILLGIRHGFLIRLIKKNGILKMK